MRNIKHTEMHVMHQLAPKHTKFFYLPGPSICGIDFVHRAGGRLLTTEFGYFVIFSTKIESFKVIIRSLCAVPLRERRFYQLLGMAVATAHSKHIIRRADNNETSIVDEDAFRLLPVIETSHFRAMKLSEDI